VLLAAGLRTAYAVVFEINTVYTRVFVHFYDGASISISRSNKIHLCQGDVNAGMQGRGHAGTNIPYYIQYKACKRGNYVYGKRQEDNNKRSYR
jgi:hypothetical protein